MDGLHVAVFIAFKVGGGGEIDAGIVAELGGGLFLAVVHLVGLGPFGPRIVRGAGHGRFGHDFELRDGPAAVTDAGAHAVGAGVAAADDDDVFFVGGDVVIARIEHGLGVRREEVHGEVDALQFAAGNWQITRLGGSGGDDDGVEVLAELLGGDVGADVDVALEGDAFVFEQLHAAEDDFLLVELHVGDAIHEEATGTVGTLKDGDGVASFVELRGGAEAGGAGANDGDFFAGALFRRLGLHPAFVPAFVDDADLDVLDRDGRIIDAEHAGAFARRGADAAGELGEVVGLVQTVERFLPEAAIDEIIPLGDDVVDRAAGGHAADERAAVAEGDAAVHAAGALLFEAFFGEVKVKFLPVLDALERIAVGGQFAGEFDEAGWFSHGLKNDA